MTPDEFRTARARLGWTQAEAAKALGYHGAAKISALETGRRAIGKTVSLLMQAYLDGWKPDNGRP